MLDEAGFKTIVATFIETAEKALGDRARITAELLYTSDNAQWQISVRADIGRKHRSIVRDRPFTQELADVIGAKLSEWAAAHPV